LWHYSYKSGFYLAVLARISDNDDGIADFQIGTIYIILELPDRGGSGYQNSFFQIIGAGNNELGQINAQNLPDRAVAANRPSQISFKIIPEIPSKSSPMFADAYAGKKNAQRYYYYADDNNDISSRF